MLGHILKPSVHAETEHQRRELLGILRRMISKHILLREASLSQNTITLQYEYKLLLSSGVGPISLHS
jgi:hypothetical protein